MITINFPLPRKVIPSVVAITVVAVGIVVEVGGILGRESFIEPLELVVVVVPWLELVIPILVPIGDELVRLNLRIEVIEVVVRFHVYIIQEELDAVKRMGNKIGKFI